MPREATLEKRAPASTPDQALVALSHELDNRMAIMAASSAAGVDPERLKMVALSTFTRTPTLWECTPVSVARAIVEAGQLGLEPTGLLGGAYLVPYWNKNLRAREAQMIVSYSGLVRLARRSGEVSRVEARVVRAQDRFDYAYGLEPTLRHVPDLSEDPGPLAYVYAVAYYRNGDRQFDVMSAAEVEAIRKRSKAADDGPWVTDHFEMAKKTVLRRLCKLLPLTVDLQRALEIEDAAETDAAPPPAVHVRQSALRAELQASLGAQDAPSPSDSAQDARPADPAPTTLVTVGPPATAAWSAAEIEEALDDDPGPVPVAEGQLDLLADDDPS